MQWFKQTRFLGPQTEVVGGGGPAGGLSNNLISMLQQLMNTGGTGTAGRPNAPGSAGDIYSVLSDILKGAEGGPGSAITKMLQTQQTRDVNQLRSRFGASGGQAYGSPGAYAESNYRAQAAPQITTAISQMQMGAINSLLPIIAGISGKAIPNAQIVQTPGFLDQVLKVAGGAANAYSAFANPWGAAAKAITGGPSGVVGGGPAGIVDPRRPAVDITQVGY